MFFRRFLRDRHQPDGGPEVHLHAPHRVPEGPGDVHVPGAAQLGPGPDARPPGRLAQHHRRGLCHREPVRADRRDAQREATESVLVTFHLLEEVNHSMSLFCGGKKYLNYYFEFPTCTYLEAVKCIFQFLEIDLLGLFRPALFTLSSLFMQRPV